MIQTLLGLGAFGMLLAVFIWFLPVVLILRSEKTHGLEKLIWLGLIFFFSWFSWILYALLAPVSRKEP